MPNIKIYLIESSQSDVALLGRTAREYMQLALRAGSADERSPLFGGFISVGGESASDFYVGGEIRIPKACFDGAEFVAALPADMPLLSVESLLRALDVMLSRGIDGLSLGRGRLERARKSPSERNFSVNDVNFLSIDSAKNHLIVYNELKSRVLERLVQSGVTVFDAATTHIDDTVAVESGAVIEPFSRISGASVIRSGALVDSSRVHDSVLERGCEVRYSYVFDSTVGEGATVGPFARLRSAAVGARCRLGDFVEVKNSTLDSGVKCAHLAYIGDARVGARTNVGCGTVFCNYDGKTKHRCEVGADVFIGANANLIAPLSLGDGAFIAAGTTVTTDVADGAFVIGRTRAEVKPNCRANANRNNGSGAPT